MDWIDLGCCDLWEAFSGPSNDDKIPKTPVRTPSQRKLRRQLFRAVERGNVARVEDLLRGGGEGDEGGEEGEGGVREWPPWILEYALKHAADAATVAVIARTCPDFFNSLQGAPAALYTAIKKDDDERLHMLLEAGMELNFCSGRNPVEFAVEWNSIRCLSTLLEAGASVQDKHPSIDVQPLHVAANLDRKECMKILLIAGADVRIPDTQGWLPLHHAANSGAYNAMMILLDAGAFVNAIGPLDQTPLHLCAKGYKSFHLSFDTDRFEDQFDSHKCCEILLEQGADVHAVNDYNRTPLLEAIYFGNRKVLEILVKGGANPMQCTDEGDTALHIAATYCGNMCENIIDFLVAKGLDVNAKADDGDTPLIRAIFAWNARAILRFLEHGADIEISNCFEQSPLQCAAADGFTEGLQILLKAGADVNSRRDNGETPAHESACSYPKILRILAAAGADMEACTDDGSTPLHYAARGWQVDSLDVCAEFGTNLQARDNRGWTAMHFAATDGTTTTMEWMLQRASSDPSLASVLGVGARAYDGSTPLHEAARRGETGNVVWLLRNGAQPNALDEDRRSALHAAALSACPHTVRALLEGARGCGRVRELRDADGRTAAQIANEELQLILERWCLAA